jgi:YD repeat-containing protein
VGKESTRLEARARPKIQCLKCIRRSSRSQNKRGWQRLRKVVGRGGCFLTAEARRGYDADSRLTSLSFTTPGNNSLGQLAYNYDNDSRLTSESGSPASLNLPQTEGPNVYTNTNQIQSWNSQAATMDKAGNLTSDPTSTALFAWDARNQLTSVTNGPASSFTASYDAILRRDSQTTAFGGTTSYVHDNRSVAQSSNTNTPNPISNYLAMPGTGEVLAFASTAGGTTNTFVPLEDGQGSALGLVNSGNVLQTQFTYDPFGNPTTTGTASQYPYLFRGMEYDATGLYQAGGIYYSPALGRPLQQVSPGGLGGGGGGINAFQPRQRRAPAVRIVLPTTPSMPASGQRARRLTWWLAASLQLRVVHIYRDCLFAHAYRLGVVGGSRDPGRPGPFRLICSAAAVRPLYRPAITAPPTTFPAFLLDAPL